MARELNFSDIQGNVTRAYGRYSFPFARYFFLHFENDAAGRKFINALRGKITTAERWKKDASPEDGGKPLTTLNVGFTWKGLFALNLPTRTLGTMPSEFIDGMLHRADILKDDTKQWDKIWRQNINLTPNAVHMWVSMNAQGIQGTDKPVKQLEDETKWLRNLCKKTFKNKVRIIPHNGRSGKEEYQSANAIFETLPNGAKIPTPKEHFGLTDGIGEPVFKGNFALDDVTPPGDEEKNVLGRGKWMNNKWEPLETGEFILGHVDESQELPPTAEPPSLMLNGTFMVFRKLHENVKLFWDVIDNEAKSYAKAMKVPLEEAKATLLAKMIGRWQDGVPLSTVPTYQEWKDFVKKEGFYPEDPTDNDQVIAAAQKRAAYLKSEHASNFTYKDDIDGVKCPVGAHLRRVNTRDYLSPENKAGAKNEKSNSALNKRRRILRRGLPYGPTTHGSSTNDTEQGVAMMMICANIFRQFEFIQQQWIQYSLDFRAGNNTCPMVGDHSVHKRHVINSDPKSGKPPYVMNKLENFVEVRGGDYFFIPSLNALRMMGMGIVDPT